MPKRCSGFCATRPSTSTKGSRRRRWRRGIGSAAVGAMLEELASGWGVHTFVAALKARNFRSMGLLTHLGFEPASAAQAARYEHDPSDEVVLLKSAASLASTRLDPGNGAEP